MLKNFRLLLALLVSVSALNAAPKAVDQLGLDSFEIDLPKPDFSLVRTFEDLSDDLSGENLFQYLHKRTEIKTPLSYTTSSNLMFSSVDNFTCENGKSGVFAFYSLTCVNGTSSEGSDYHEEGDKNGDGYKEDCMNIEHIWPQSFFDKNLPMRSDMHHLRPTFTKPNNVRGSFSFGEVENYVYSVNSGAKFDGQYFEPPDSVKGDVARAILYFVVRYYDKKIKPSNYNDFFLSKVETFLKWNRMDQPDSYEKTRNDRVYAAQGNRNPFIDDYTLADRIGEKVFKTH